MNRLTTSLSPAALVLWASIATGQSPPSTGEWEPEVRRAMPVQRAVRVESPSPGPSSSATESPTPGGTPSPRANPSWMDRLPSATPAETPVPVRPAIPVASPAPTGTPAPQSTPYRPSTAGASPGSTRPPVAQAVSEEGTTRLAPGKKPEDPAGEDLAKANSIYARKMYEFAAMEYEEFLKNHPDADGRDIAYFRLAECRRRLGQPEQALTIYEKLCNEFDSGEFFGAGAYRLGEALYKEKNYEGALGRFRAAIGHSKEDEVRLSAKYQAARCLQQLNRTPEATRLFAEVADIPDRNPYRDYARFALAEGLIEEGKKQEALSLYEELIPGVSGEMQAEAAVKAAAIASELGDRMKARKLFSDALTVKGGEKWRPVALIGKMRLDAAEKRFGSVAATPLTDLRLLSGESRAEALALVASAHKELGNPRKAKEYYDLLVEEFPESPHSEQIRFQRILAMHQLGDPATRKELAGFIGSATGGKDIERANLLIAEIDFREGLYTSAAQAYQAVLQSGLPENVKRQAAYKRAWALSESGESGPAVEAFNAYLEKYPEGDELPAVHLNRGLAHQKSGNTDAALEDFNAVLTRWPRAPEREVALQHKALALGQKNDLPGMKAAFSELLADFPDSKAAAQAEFWTGWADFESEDYEAALPKLRRARELDAKTYGARSGLRIALCYYYKQDRAALIAEMQRGDAPSLPPDVSRWLGLQSAIEGDFVTAEKVLASMVDGGSTDPDVLITLAECRNAMGKTQQAMENARKYIELAKEPAAQARGLLAVAEAERVSENFEAASEAVQEALRLQPEGRINAAARMTAAEIEFSKKEYDNAARGFLSVAVLYEDPVITPRALKRAADAYYRIGNDAEAEKALAELKRRFPDEPPPRANSASTN